jgi:hypothetical protein
VGKTSTHPEKVQTNTSKHFHPLAYGISVKSTIRFLKSVPPTLCTWGGTLGPCWGLFLAHKLHFSHTLTYAGELGDIKMLGQGGLKSCQPWVSSFIELLDKCGMQWFKYGNVAISKLPPSVQ